MSPIRIRPRLALLLIAPAAALVAGGVYLAWPAGGDPRLRAFVHGRPPVPIVFTSRSEPASLAAAAGSGEGFTYPGQGLWQAREGRLRLLKPDGTVHELTWGKQLPDGSTLIDVMSPSVSLDGERVYFAGRKAAPDPGRFRLYQVNIDGSGLRQLTGGADDPGCTALPPMRYRSESDRSPLSDEERKRIDYDDVDPAEMNFQVPRLAFASSRTPDLGRGQARRATNIWELRLDTGARRPLTANRYNDRWPYQLASNFVSFSLWSHNREVIAPGERDIVPWVSGMSSPRRPPSAWLGAFLQPVGGQFGGLLKPSIPVWRPRPLFNGRFAFQTHFTPPTVGQREDEPAANSAQGPAPDYLFEVVQAEPGLLLQAPSAETGEPRSSTRFVRMGPNVTRDGEVLSLATPSPCPDSHVLLAATPLPAGSSARVDPRGYGIWLCRDDWTGRGVFNVTATDSELRLLFDDPELVDAEPVAVYARHFDRFMDATDTPPAGEPPAIKLASGSTWNGPSGTLFGSSLYASQHADAPGQTTPRRPHPFYTAPPEGEMSEIRVYASYRDRFDDPLTPRIPGGWELLVKGPVTGATFGLQVPAGIPIVLAGFDRRGRVLSWLNDFDAAPDAGAGGSRRFFAFAGDHYSAARPGGKHFCIGCHPGHSGLGRDDHRHQERVR